MKQPKERLTITGGYVHHVAGSPPPQREMQVFDLPRVRMELPDGFLFQIANVNEDGEVYESGWRDLKDALIILMRFPNDKIEISIIEDPGSEVDNGN